MIKINKENKTIIKALNMFGRVPEQWELLDEIERLNNIITELERFLKYEIYCDFNKEMTKSYQDTLDKLKELKENK